MITKIEVEQYSTATNAAVIRLPGRRYPGVVLQGDSLKILLDCAKDAADLAFGSSPELQESIGELVEMLQAKLQVYKDALKLNGQELPYKQIGARGPCQQCASR